MKYPVLFVSLGPGDPELITLKSLKALQMADAIFCPMTLTKTGEKKSRAAEMLNTLLATPPLVPFTLPMSKRRVAAQNVYDTIFEQIKQLHEDGKRIAVAVEGDAGIYASIHYVLERLIDASIPVEQLAGVPSFIASSSWAHLHLIQQEKRLVVLPGIVTSEELNGYLTNNHTVVIMKLSQCAESVKQYMATHSEYSYHYFENVGTAQTVYLCDTQQIIKREIPYFSLLIIKHQ